MKHLFKFSLLLLALLLPATAMAHDFEVDGIYYLINGDQATVTFSPNYNYSGDVIIPATVTYNDITYSVTSIGSNAFEDCYGLTSVTIPNSVTSIGDYAFLYCWGLTSITIPNSVASIGESAFAWSGLTSIDIPNSVTTISINAFSYSGLTGELTIPSSVKTIESGAFSGCQFLSSVIIGDSVITIGDSAFFFCWNLNGVTIGNSVTTIGNWAFSSCYPLSDINIPNSVITIGAYAFSDCNWNSTNVTIGSSVAFIGDRAFENCNVYEIYSMSLEPPTVGDSTFDDYNITLSVPDISLESYQAADYWKEFVNIIGMPYTFEVDGTSYHATTLNTASVMADNEGTLYSGDMVIPDSVTYEGYTFAVTGIENNAFDGCYELTSITIPSTVDSIGEQAFQGCTGLKSVTIGSGVTSIGSKAFNYCNSLETVKCIGTVPPVMASTDCFSTAAYNRATLMVPRNSEATYAAADYWYKFAHIEGWGSAARGDIDGDGLVNIADVTALIDAMLNGDNEGVYFESADLNSNGRLDIGDVTSLIDDLLYGN